LLPQPPNSAAVAALPATCDRILVALADVGAVHLTRQPVNDGTVSEANPRGPGILNCSGPHIDEVATMEFPPEFRDEITKMRAARERAAKEEADRRKALRAQDLQAQEHRTRKWEYLQETVRTVAAAALAHRLSRDVEITQVVRVGRFWNRKTTVIRQVEGWKLYSHWDEPRDDYEVVGAGPAENSGETRWFHIPGHASGALIATSGELLSFSWRGEVFPTRLTYTTTEQIEPLPFRSNTFRQDDRSPYPVDDLMRFLVGFAVRHGLDKV
jgi:hypothetical protein